MTDRDEEQTAAGRSAESGPLADAPQERDYPERVRSDQEIAVGLRLRPERERVTRLSRRVLAGLGAASAVVLGGALLFALRPHGPATGAPELISTETAHAPEGLNGLPRDYASVPRPAPQLGPPLPGDLGRPILNAGVPAPGMPQSLPPAQPDPEAQRLAQAHAQLAQERESARTSRLFASEARGAVPPIMAAGAGSPPAVPTVDPISAGSNAGQTSQPSEADRKLAFLTAPVDRRTSSLERVQRPASPNVVQAGSVIPAAMLTGLRSDLPGQITAQVTGAVYDSPTGKVLLIPQGARLIGQYDAQVAFGQARALLVWDRIVFPNGKSIVLERQPGADPAGYAGVEDRIDNHWGSLFKAALLSTILSVGSEAGTSNDENGLLQAIRRGSSDSISQTGRQVVGRSLNIQPTITVRPGFPVRVIVTRDLDLDPYQD